MKKGPRNSIVFCTSKEYGTVITAASYGVDHGEHMATIIGTIVSQNTLDYFVKIFVIDEQTKVFIVANSDSFTRKVRSVAFDLLADEDSMVAGADIDLCEDEKMNIIGLVDSTVEAIEISYAALASQEGE